MNVNVRRAVRMGIAGLALAVMAVGLAVGQVRQVHSENIWAIPTTDALAVPGSPVLNAAGVYVAPVLDARPAATVLLALHGQSGSGPGIAARLRECAQRHGWILVAPTMAYRDFLDAEQVRLDGEQNLAAVHGLLESVRGAGVPLKDAVLVYGFSRGAQMAHRFAMAYPHEVRAVAALSAGSYTLPSERDGQHAPLDYPFGVADLAEVTGTTFDQAAFLAIPFWVGVGASDTNPLDIGRAWDGYEGRTRVDRANAFASALQARGADVSMNVFAAAGHEETAAMRSGACEFLAEHSYAG